MRTQRPTSHIPSRIPSPTLSHTTSPAPSRSPNPPKSAPHPQPPSDEVSRQLALFGVALREARRRAGVSKRQLAEAAGFDRAAITRIEKGGRAPKFDKLLLLAHATKTTPQALLAEIEPPPESRRTLSDDRYPPHDLLTRERRARDREREGGDPHRAGPHRADPHGGDLGELDPRSRFAANLRRVRMNVQPYLTQEGLALEADLDHSSPNAYETGRKAPPTLRTILKLALGLGVGPGVLLEGVELRD